MEASFESTMKSALAQPAAENKTLRSITGTTGLTATRAASVGSRFACGYNYTGSYRYLNRTNACIYYFYKLDVWFNEYDSYTKRVKSVYKGSAMIDIRTNLTSRSAGKNIVDAVTYVNTTGTQGKGLPAILKPSQVDFDPQDRPGWQRLDASSTPVGPTSRNSLWIGKVSLFRKDLASGKSADTAPFNHRIGFSNPVYIQGKHTMTSPVTSVQCDRIINTAQTGCVFRQYTPTVTFSKTKTREMATHLKKALDSNLPQTLTRTTTAKANKNRAMACGSSAVKKQVAAATKKYKVKMSCDEYPFASTTAGAAVKGAYARVFSGCNISPLIKGNGSRGYSRCIIPLSQNSSQGGTLSAFYRNNHVIPGNRYKVKVS